MSEKKLLAPCGCEYKFTKKRVWILHNQQCITRTSDNFTKAGRP